MTADFDYKKYSLEHLENWLHDALNCEDLTPQDIYETITNVVDENIEYHKKYLTKNIEFLSLLKGHRPAVDFDYTATGEKFPQYTEEELNAMCEKAASDQEKEKCREYNLREAEYYDKRAKLDMNSTYDDMIAAGYTMTDDGFWIKEENKQETVKKKWCLPVQQSVVDGVEDYYIEFPDDLLDAANLKVGDEVEWIDLKNGSYQLRKITKPLGMDEC